MPPKPASLRIPWYRSPVPRDVLTTLNQRSDWKGLVQTLGHLGLLVLTGAGAWYAATRLPLPVFLIDPLRARRLLGVSAERLPRALSQDGLQDENPQTAFLYIVSFSELVQPGPVLGQPPGAP